MKLTLKEARRLERRIYDQHLSSGLKVQKSINIYTTVDIDELIGTSVDEISRNTNVVLGMIHLRQDIRRQIQIANESSGINQLISDREAATKILDIYSTVADHGANFLQLDSLANNVNSRIKAAEKGLDRYGYDTIQYTPINEAGYNSAKSLVNITQREIDRLDDKMAGLNANTKIGLSEETVTFLKDHDMI